jgi:type VI secretion system secreted protein VgrG
MLEVRSRTGADHSFSVAAVHGVEALSQPHRFTVQFVIPGRDGLSSDTILGLLGRPARLSLAGDHLRSGLLSEITLLPASGGEASVRYEAVLESRIVRSRLSRGYHVYQDARVPALVAAILRRHGLEMPDDFVIAVDPARWSRRLDHVVQHDETDFAFISRMMERWGLFYFFDEHDGDRMVIADGNDAFPRLDQPLRFDARENTDAPDPQVIWGLSRRHRWLPRTVKLTDYNWRVAAEAAHPSAEAAIDAEIGHGVQQHYGGNVRDATVATQLAKVRAESVAVDREVYEGSTQCPDLAPGVIFEVVDHPQPELCRAYLVTRVEIEGRGDPARGELEYVTRFEAIPAETPYRAPLVTPWPHIAGVTHGFVAGVDLGAAAAVDETGAYTVRVPYDLAGAKGTRASRPIRKAEPASGPDHGVHLPLHVGAEVALAHVNGDPDRPIIVGAVPNAATPSPVREPDATKGRIRSRGGVEIEIDDAPR